MPKAKFGTFDDLLQIAEESARPVAEALRKIVFQVDPNTFEVVRLGYRAANYGVGSERMSVSYAYMIPYKEWVDLGFYQGVELADPDGLLEGSGAKLRHVKIRSIHDANRPTVRVLIEGALERGKASKR